MSQPYKGMPITRHQDGSPKFVQYQVLNRSQWIRNLLIARGRLNNDQVINSMVEQIGVGCHPSVINKQRKLLISQGII